MTTAESVAESSTFPVITRKFFSELLMLDSIQIVIDSLKFYNLCSYSLPTQMSS